MNPSIPAPLAGAIRRIWAQITANSSDIGDTFERMIQSFYSKIVRPGDIVIDGGAHTGRHTIPLALLVGDHGSVVAFEPLPLPAAKLKQLLEAAGLERRVRIHPDALARELGKHEFFIVHNMPEYSGLRSRQYVDFVAQESRIMVDLQTIDSVVPASGQLSFIKLDLEGGEFRALQGAERTLRLRGPACIFENGLESSASGYESAEFFGYFNDLDYELYDILGSRVDESLWRQPGPWYFVALPRARRSDLLPLLWASALEELLATPWAPRDKVTAVPADSMRQASTSSAMVGHLDRVDRLIRLSGWAGDLAAGCPPRSLTIVVDGTVVHSEYRRRTRHDVLAETAKIGLADAGFEITLRAAGDSIEVYAEAGDGTLRKLQQP